MGTVMGQTFRNLKVGRYINSGVISPSSSTLKAWAALPGIQLDLVLRGETHQVIFDHAKGGFTAQPIWKLLDGEITPELMYRPTFKFLKV
jgi:hypothetical protein